jgi:hypothetical protein
LCQYTSGTPTWQQSWSGYWLWQFTDGQTGPGPHEIPGIGHCDINSYDQDGGVEQLIAEWATGSPQPPQPDTQVVEIVITAPPGVEVKVRQTTAGMSTTKNARDKEGTS